MLALFVFLFGLALGSFLNVVIVRLRAGEGLGGRSRCPRCGVAIRWYYNLPLLSFLWLGGRCVHCRQPISWQYPLVELTSGLLWLVGYLVLGGPLNPGSAQELAAALGPAAAFGTLASFLLVLFVFDLRWYVLPDAITLPGLAVAIAFNLAAGRDWRWLVGVAALGALFFGFQYAVSRGRWVGSGDIRLGALVGAAIGSWRGLLTALLLAYVGGSLVAVVLLATRRKAWRSELPFGTFLTVATVIVLLWGESLGGWYGRLVGW